MATAERKIPKRLGGRGTLPDDFEVELPERSHLEGCPMPDDRLDWETFIPKTGDLKGVEVVKVRCVQCGGEKITPLGQ